MHPLRMILTAALAVAAVALAPAATAEPLPFDHNGYNGAPTVISGQPAPTMNGVPCVSGNLGACTGFAQNQPVPKKPQAKIGHSPTVR